MDNVAIAGKVDYIKYGYGKTDGVISVLHHADRDILHTGRP